MLQHLLLRRKNRFVRKLEYIYQNSEINDGWVRMVSTYYKTPISNLDNLAYDEALFTQELASLIIQTSINNSRYLSAPTGKESATEHRIRVRKMQKSKSVIDRLSYWFYTRSKLPS